ncbi:hypothetical protein RJ639_043299 [Escallonia herrerae]|uniref:Structure-specific endonuclease subunit SLX1 homolog n=1 Tax=Escallonia herrerae TaxID=1293975 RepID=A0AA88WKQ3_9ASTE|nr:hypothetical protein RJ639_043299 [Escallonia herrerae]
MVKRKARSAASETLLRKEEDDDQTVLEEEEEEEKEEGDGGSGFFACYLLTSLSPRFKGHTYIGFTVNPRRRIRQHNGEIRSGAWRTKKRRPWEMVFCIYGFPTNVAALQFEWAWQHPVESLAVRKAAVEFKSLSGLANKIKLAYTMLTLPAWQSLNLTVHFFSTKYTNHAAGCPSLPEQMKVKVGSMDELPCYNARGAQNVYGDDACDDDFLSDDFSADAALQDFEDHENRCREVNGADRSISERSVDATFRKYADLQSSKENCRSVDAALHSPESDRGVEENGLIQSRNSPVQRQDDRQPFWVVSSPQRSPTSFLDSFSILKTVEARDALHLIDEDVHETDCPTQENLLTTAVTDQGQPPFKTRAVAGEVEVIDVFTPSPSYEVSRSKKSRASTVCPQIIDLTQSPIFV